MEKLGHGESVHNYSIHYRGCAISGLFSCALYRSY